MHKCSSNHATGFLYDLKLLEYVIFINIKDNYV